MQSRVHQLDLHLAVHEPQRRPIAEIQQCVQQEFVTAVLNSLEKAMHRRYGEQAILHVRQLEVRWAIDTGRLADAQYLDALGNELADEFQRVIEQRTATENLLPSRDYAAFLFENPAHRWAVNLAHAFDKPQSNGVQIISDSWSSILASDSSRLPAILDYLSRMQLLLTLIQRLDIGLLQQTLATVPIKQWPEDAIPALTERLAPGPEKRSHDSDATLSPLQCGKQQPSTQGESFWPETSSSSEQSTQTTTHSAVINHRDSTVTQDDQSCKQQRADDHGGTEDAVANRAAIESVNNAWNSHHTLHADSGNQQAVQGQGQTATQIQNGVRPADESSSQIGEHSLPHGYMEPEQAWLHSDYAGAFYLLNVIMELDLPEHLWCVGINEGDFLHLVFHNLLGAEAHDDPAPLMLATRPHSEHISLAAVAEWAAEEVQHKSVQALQAMCRRRAIALIDQDLQSRLQQNANNYMPTCEHSYANASGIKLVAFCTALIVQAFCLRLGRTLSMSDVQHMLQIPGRIEIGDETIVIVMPMESIDIGLRSVALDVNPGYLPWLKRKIVFVYEETD